MLTMFYSIDCSHPNENEFEQRVEDCAIPVVGDLTWMIAEGSPINEWEVIATHLFKNLNNPEQSFCFAEVVKGTVVERDVPESVKLYMLDGEIYTYGICGGEVSPPKLGSFDEYEPGSSNRLPVDKHAVSYETLIGDGFLSVYMVNLQRVPLPVAA